MENLFRYALGIILATLITIFTIVRIGFEIIGISTAPDDFAQLQRRMPKVFEWLFSTPWWAPTLLLLCVTALAAWLIWGATKNTAAEQVNHFQPIDAAAISLLIDERIAARSLANMSPDDASNSEILRLGDVCSKLTVDVDAVSRAIAKLDEVSKNSDAILENTLNKVIQSLDTRVGTINERLAAVDRGFAAIANREWHFRLFSELSDEYERINEPIQAARGLHDPDEWADQLSAWNVRLGQWLNIVEYYAPGTGERVMNTPESLYEEKRWSFDESKITPLQVHKFKTASIKWMNARQEKKAIDQAFVYKAFHSPSKRVERDEPPRPISLR